MRLLRSRRGDWIQIFMLLFFALLIVVAIALLTIEAKRLQTERPQLKEDLSEQHAAAMVISLLRTQVSIDCNGVKGKDTLASLISINDGSCDERILTTVSSLLPANDLFVLYITYGDGRSIRISNSEWLYNVHKQKESSTEETFVGTMIGTGHALLPGNGGNIEVRLIVPDSEFLSFSKNQLAKEERKVVLVNEVGSKPSTFADIGPIDTVNGPTAEQQRILRERDQ